MGVTVHRELRNFLLLLTYPKGLSCDECIQMAYDRGYKETLQTIGSYNSKGELEHKTEKRIESHMRSNYKDIKHDAEYAKEHNKVNTIEELVKNERGRWKDQNSKNYSDAFFNLEDGKAYFIPGDDKSKVRSWNSHGLEYAYDYIARYHDKDGHWCNNKKFPIYEEMKSEEPKGWENHGKLLMVFYIEKFPGKSAYDILIESGDHVMKEWPQKFIKWLKNMKVPESGAKPEAANKKRSGKKTSN